MSKLCDGRTVYINGDLVEDVLSIPILSSTYEYVCKYYSMQKEYEYHTYSEEGKSILKLFILQRLKRLRRKAPSIL